MLVFKHLLFFFFEKSIGRFAVFQNAVEKLPKGRLIALEDGLEVFASDVVRDLEEELNKVCGEDVVPTNNVVMPQLGEGQVEVLVAPNYEVPWELVTDVASGPSVHGSLVHEVVVPGLEGARHAKG